MTKVELIGESNVRAVLIELPKRVQRKALRAAVTAGSTPINRAAKAGAPVASGLTRKAIARKIKAYKGAAVAVIGAKTDLSATVRRALKKGNVRLANLATRAVPARYIHLIEKGTKPHSIGKWQHPGTKANPFLEMAYQRTKGQAKELAAAKLREVIEQEAKSLGRL